MKHANVLRRIEEPADLRRLGSEELAALAAECRERIIEVITRRGGHLASNLGVVELTLALHRGFDSPRDRLVWDTSNQCYTHKLVTGRRDAFASVRLPGGLSGFAEPRESPHDALAAGHAGTGLSYALGLALALRDAPGSPWVIAVVGDGAMTSGLSYEGLNNIAHLKPRRLIVVLNDNGWSISENVGWLPAWRTSSRPAAVWESLGMGYLGPVDGHDLGALEDALARAKTRAEAEGPVLIHVRTRKGLGYPPAEENPVKFHQPSTPAASSGGRERPTYSQVFARTLIRLMERDPRVVAISAAMLEGTGLAEVRRAFPARVHDVGIAEAHAVTMACGMAKAGLRPVVALYSTFLQRAFDQILHDACLQDLPVTLAIDRAGLVGDDGKTHQGVYDVSFTRCLPGLVAAGPKDENELQHMLLTALRSARPFALRYPRGAGLGVALDPEPVELPIGRAEILAEGRDLTFLAYGSMVGVALDAAEALGASGLRCGVVNARFAKPVDLDCLRRLSGSTRRLVTLEEHTLAGGFGSAVLETFLGAGLNSAVLRCHGLADAFIEQAPAAAQRAAAGLDAAGVARKVFEFFPELGGQRAMLGPSPQPSPARAGEGEAREAAAW